MTVQCREVRQLADAFLSDQLLVETTHEMVRHLEGCPTCREEIAARRALRAKLQNAFASAAELAPRPEFVAVLPARLRSGGGQSFSRREWLQSWWAMAAGVAAVVGGGLFARGALRRSHLATVARDAVGDHRNCALTFNLAERPIPLDEAARRYDAAYAALATLELPATLGNDPLEIIDRHSCVYQGRRFGHIVSRYRNQVVSLLVTLFPESVGSVPEMLPPDDGLHTAAFSSAGHVAFIVSDLSEREVAMIAGALAGPVSRRLAGA